MAFGMEVYSSGSVKLIEVSSRCTVSVERGTSASISTGGFVTINVTGMANNGNWQVFIYPNSAPNNLNSDNYSQTINTGSFRIDNDMGVSSTFEYFVLKSG
jgi:hypothetical protein